VDDLDKAEKRLKGEWPKNPVWIFTSPDGGRSVYRSMRSDICPEELKIDGQAPKQLYKLGDQVVGTDNDYGLQGEEKW